MMSSCSFTPTAWYVVASNAPAWPALQQRLADSAVDVRVLPIAHDQGQRVLSALGVTEHSTLGALAANTGGLVVDHGWLRVLGGGHANLPDLVQANEIRASTPPPYLIVAYDALGGRFAIDGGGLEVEPGEVCYFGPDTLSWTGIGGGHTAFVDWALAGGLPDFYADLRWGGWEREVTALGLDQGLAIYPPPFTTEGRDIATAARRPVPLVELIDFYEDMARQLAGHADGSTFQLTVDGSGDPAQPPGN